MKHRGEKPPGNDQALLRQRSGSVEDEVPDTDAQVGLLSSLSALHGVAFPQRALKVDAGPRSSAELNRWTASVSRSPRPQCRAATPQARFRVTGRAQWGVVSAHASSR